MRHPYSTAIASALGEASKQGQPGESLSLSHKRPKNASLCNIMSLSCFCESYCRSSIVQAGLPINDNYGMWLSHHQKLSSYGQKSSWRVRLDTLNRFVKGIGMKIVWRCRTEKRVFGPIINPNSKLSWFISVLINPAPKCQFFDPTFMCDCLLVK